MKYKRILALALALVTVFALTVSVSAAEVREIREVAATTKALKSNFGKCNFIVFC